jgi:hypothetical protein
MRAAWARAAASAAVMVVVGLPAAAFAAAPGLADGIALWRWSKTAAPAETARFAAKGDSIAAGDLGHDGVSEIVVGAAFGGPPTVRVLRGDGTEILSFLAYDKDMAQGVTVAVGDVDGDGKAEIVTGTGPGAAAHVRVFDGSGHEKLIPGGFFPFGSDFMGGVNLAVADTDGDGKAEIVAAPGPTGGPHVTVWSGAGRKKADFFAFDNGYPYGLNVAAGDLDGDGKAEIVAALAGASPPAVRVFDGATGAKLREFAGIRGFEGGLNLSVGDVDGDGTRDILVAANGGGGPHVFAYHGDGTALGSFFAYDETYMGGVLLAVADLGSGPAIVTLPAERGTGTRPELPQFIRVSVAKQRLEAFEYGRLVKTFLVATGLERHPTPIGDFQVLAKPYKVDYRWTYSPGNKDNYDMGWVTWNLRFANHTYIHYAPWRKVFGVRGSHGCVNVNKADAQWIYKWAPVRTPVTITE